MNLTPRIHRALADVPESTWNALLPPGNPFLDHRFLLAFETAGIVGESTPWRPRHVTLWNDERLIAGAPLYEKLDSYGEFIFDFQWAEAYARSGLDYYPKGVCAVPFTPATGERLLIEDGPDAGATQRELWRAMRAEAARAGWSSLHVLFCRRHETETLAADGAMPRLTFQFHWENRGYATFDDFLGDLRAGKRKQIRKERQAVRDSGVEVALLTGSDIATSHIDALYDFYRRNQADRWGRAYLNRAWFETIHATAREDLVATLAWRGDRMIGGTLNFRRGDRLYGRYWGCREQVEFLHFECCYYRLIEYAIDAGIQLYEAGAQGEHKFLRGFATRPTWSAHDIAHPQARQAIGRFLHEETRHAEATILAYNRQSPLKHVRERTALDTAARRGHPA